MPERRVVERRLDGLADLCVVERRHTRVEEEVPGRRLEDQPELAGIARLELNERLSGQGRRALEDRDVRAPFLDSACQA